MPFLDNLILGKPGGDRRRRYAEEVGPVPGFGDKGKAETLLSTLQRRTTAQFIRDPEEREERRPCGNLTCGKGWTLPWKSRERPVFDGQWACSRACLSAMVKAALTRETADGVYEEGPEPHHHRVPLGLVMLAHGWITHPQLQRALEAQRAHAAGRIGEWLVSECGLKPERIASGLSAQWNCPVLSTEGAWPEAMALALPRVFLEEYGAVPLRVAGKKLLYVGFQDSLDASTSFALERMTGLRAESGLLPEAEFIRARETLLRCEFPWQSMATVSDRDGLARAIADTVEHEQPEASRLVRLHRYYWLRVWAKGDVERAAGDLPLDAKGVRDYLFEIGSRVVRPAPDEKKTQVVAATERRRLLEEPTEIAAAGLASGEPRVVTETHIAEENAATDREMAHEERAASGVENVLADLTVGEEEIALEDETVPEAEANVELQTEASDVKTVTVASQRSEGHFLAKRDFWSDEDEIYAGASQNVRQEDQPISLQRLMRRSADDELEAIDGEYLPVEETVMQSIALVPETRPSSWIGLGLLRRLKPSFPDRETRPGPGPGQGV